GGSPIVMIPVQNAHEVLCWRAGREDKRDENDSTPDFRCWCADRAEPGVELSETEVHRLAPSWAYRPGASPSVRVDTGAALAGRRTPQDVRHACPIPALRLGRMTGARSEPALASPPTSPTRAPRSPSLRPAARRPRSPGTCTTPPTTRARWRFSPRHSSTAPTAPR